jgi:two-component system, sensor histidine kinase and response regulator
MADEKHTLILLIEDEAEILEVMAVLLESAGYSVVRALNGVEALSQLEKCVPDIIVSDIFMPKMNGFDFYNALRNRWAMRHIPFIFLTGFSDVESVVRGRELGVDDYLIKPVDARLLLSSIRGKLKRAEEIRKSTNDQIAEIKNHLVQILTHEFRTPLTLINSTTDMLADVSMQFGPDEFKKFVSMIKEGGSRLQRLVESFLLASSIETGEALKEYNARINEYELSEIISTSVADVIPIAAEHSITIDQQSIPGDHRIRVCQKHVFEILRRLLENAVKFSLDGSTVHCRLTDDGISWSVSIEDHGRGIPSDELPKIVEKFYQVDRKRYEQQGIGLGLYIAKSLVEMNKLVLAFESAVDKGTIARLRFPKTITS